MNFQLWWFEFKNSSESIGWILLIGLVDYWGSQFIGSRPWFGGDSSLLLPFLTTHSFNGVLRGILWLPIVLVFPPSKLRKRHAFEQFLAVLPQKRWIAALHRYLGILVLQVAMMIAFYLVAKFILVFSPIAGFVPIDRYEIREVIALLCLSQVFIAIFYVAAQIAPRFILLPSCCLSIALVCASLFRSPYFSNDAFLERWYYFIPCILAFIAWEIASYIRRGSALPA
jgi:hypothetical protein